MYKHAVMHQQVRDTNKKNNSRLVWSLRWYKVLLKIFVQICVKVCFTFVFPSVMKMAKPSWPICLMTACGRSFSDSQTTKMSSVRVWRTSEPLTWHRRPKCGRIFVSFISRHINGQQWWGRERNWAAWTGIHCTSVWRGWYPYSTCIVTTALLGAR